MTWSKSMYNWYYFQLSLSFDGEFYEDVEVSDFEPNDLKLKNCYYIKQSATWLILDRFYGIIFCYFFSILQKLLNTSTMS